MIEYISSGACVSYGQHKYMGMLVNVTLSLASCSGKNYKRNLVFLWFCVGSSYTMNAYINNPTCMGTPVYMPSFTAGTCSMFSDPATGIPTGYSYKGQCLAPASAAVPTSAPNMMYPSFNSSSLPPMGYVVVSAFSTGTCMPGTLTAASGNLIGKCMPGVCSGMNANCMASLTFVQDSSFTSYGFSESYVEFSSPYCTMNSMIGSQLKYVSSYCSSGVKYTYYPLSTVPMSIVQMLTTNSPGGLAEM